MGERWKNLDPNEKAEYELCAQEDRRIHEEQVQKYEDFLRGNGYKAQPKKYKPKEFTASSTKTESYYNLSNQKIPAGMPPPPQLPTEIPPAG